MGAERKHIVERVQTGVRMEKRLLKVLRALADYLDLSLGDLLEGIVLHAFDGKSPFSAERRRRIGEDENEIAGFGHSDRREFYSVPSERSISNGVT